MSATIRGGSAIGVPGGPVGTLGCLVKVGGALRILSSAHVLARLGNAEVDQQVWETTVNGEKVRAIGRVRDVAPVDFSQYAVNDLDAALADVSDLEVVRPGIGIPPVQAAPSGISLTPAEGARVQAWGAVSGRLRTSKIVSVNWQGSINYGSLGRAEFGGLVSCKPPYSVKGDSGAAVLSEEGWFLGLHMAGDEQQSLFCTLAALRRQWPGLTVVTA